MWEVVQGEALDIGIENGSVQPLDKCPLWLNKIYYIADTRSYLITQRENSPYGRINSETLCSVQGVRQSRTDIIL